MYECVNIVKLLERLKISETDFIKVYSLAEEVSKMLYSLSS